MRTFELFLESDHVTSLFWAADVIKPLGDCWTVCSSWKDKLVTRVDARWLVNTVNVRTGPSVVTPAEVHAEPDGSSLTWAWERKSFVPLQLAARFWMISQQAVWLWHHLLFIAVRPIKAYLSLKWGQKQYEAAPLLVLSYWVSAARSAGWTRLLSLI